MRLYELRDYIGCELQVARFRDYCPNGVQVEGRSEVRRLATAVTASYAVLQAATAWGADALLVHHGYFWRGEDPRLVGIKRARIATLIAHEINLLAYHLPLDCHLTLGNNACVAKLLNIQTPLSHPAGQVDHLIWSGVLPAPVSVGEMTKQLTTIFQQPPIHIASTSAQIHRVAWCTGGAQDYIELAKTLGADAYISGEISERTYHQAKELGIHYFACGHHATERYGIQALGHHLSQHFSLTHHFIDEDNPI